MIRQVRNHASRCCVARVCARSIRPNSSTVSSVIRASTSTSSFRTDALLFDIGDISRLPTRKLLRISDVFVSHTHMDHFAGFDHLLRVCLGRDTGVRMYGPPDFIEQVGHKLHAYTWNLVENYAADFTVLVHELHMGRADAARAVSQP